ncbi:MAG TPA: NAD-dependent epimerase/dehydratase family protein [Solirubrobacteraceae bacterium]|nr:NAD-dependent epimerase/dehydratase family protein [Solirubrobacteraceae bacterium]
MRAFVIGGTGLIGGAVDRWLLAAGWDVDVLARGTRRVPEDLTGRVGFTAADRSDARAVRAAFGGGADLLVDCACFTAADAAGLLPLAAHATSTVMFSSKAVYADALGRHANSPEPPRFEGPVTESQPTVPAGDMDYRSREGYGANKVAAERVLLDSGLPVTVLRPSKVHGRGAAPARAWVFVKRVLDGRPVVLLAGMGRGIDHPSAAVNIASLVEAIAERPAARILNAADPDAPSGVDIAGIVASHLAHKWKVVLLDDDVPAPLGWHPWDGRPPVVLDTTAALGLGYRPAGDFASTIADELDWLTAVADTVASARLPEEVDDCRFDGAFDYAAEDEFLARSVRAPAATHLIYLGEPSPCIPSLGTKRHATVDRCRIGTFHHATEIQ